MLIVIASLADGVETLDEAAGGRGDLGLAARLADRRG
jgi:hypothetical protein